MSLEYESITEAVIGYGFLEKVYQKALQVELLRRGHSADLEYPIKVKFKGIVVGEYEADLFVDGKVMIELKVAKKYNPKDEAQLLNELKATEKKVGLLINFGKEKVEFKRFIY